MSYPAFSASKPIPLIINGKYVDSDVTSPVVSPLTGKEAWSFSSASLQHAKDAIEAAQKAFPTWAKTKASHRRDILLRAAEIMIQRREELAYYIRQEIAANEFYQDLVIGLAIDGLKDTAGRISGALAGQVPDSNFEGMHAMVLKRPYGVNLAIAPWNAPYHLGLRSIIFPLAAGNTVVLKGAEFTPYCYWAIADVLREAGLPDGCLNLLFSRPADAPALTEALIAHPAMTKVNFTGSTQVGSVIASLAGKHLKPVLMELGGKASAIVCKDADLQKAIMHCARGAFVNAGQICMSTERILVHSSVASAFQTGFSGAVGRIFDLPESTPMLVTAESANRNRGLVSDAVSKGAKPLDLFSTTSPEHEAVDTMMRPVILTNVTKSMDLFATESFGPSVAMYTFETEEEALELANDTEYGLSAAVFTEDLATGFRLAEGINSGAVHINSMTIHDEYPLPHGGIKKSGFGRFNGYQGLDEFLYYKTVTWMD